MCVKRFRLFVLVAVLWCSGAGVEASFGQLVRYEGDFDVTLSVAPPPGMGGGGVTDARYTGSWAVEYATEGTLTGSGVNTVDRPVSSFELNPGSLFGVVYDTENVDIHVDYRGGGLFRFMLGGLRWPNYSAVGYSSNRDDFRIEYRESVGVGVRNSAYEFKYGRSDGGPREVLSLSGRFRPAEPDPYVWGEFDFDAGFSNVDRLTGRWAIDVSHLTHLPFDQDESGSVIVPLRYLEITSDVPEDFLFDQREARAMLEFEEGVLTEISLGMGNINGVALNEPDFLVSYLLWLYDDALSYEPQDLRMSWAMSDGEGNWNDGIGWAEAWIVPEPTTVSLLALGSLAMLRRRRPTLC